jgi:hypothetical protein
LRSSRPNPARAIERLSIEACDRPLTLSAAKIRRGALKP